MNILLADIFRQNYHLASLNCGIKTRGKNIILNILTISYLWMRLQLSQQGSFWRDDQNNLEVITIHCFIVPLMQTPPPPTPVYRMIDRQV